MDKDILKEVGLTSNETEVYLTLLKEGSISVNDIAEKAGLHRQAVYDALDRLLEKGFVSFITRNNKKYFQGIHPTKILEYLQEKEEKVQGILPELIKFTKLPREDTFVEVFKGKGIIRTVYKDITKEFERRPGEVLISGVDERKFIEEDRTALQQHLRRLRELKCRERILTREGDTYLVAGAQTDYRWISKEFFNPTPIYVYGDKLFIIIWGNPTYAILIENAGLADAHRKQFNLIWSMAKKVGKNKIAR